MRLTTVIPALSAILAFTSGVAAQSPEDRERLLHLRDSLGTLHDTSAIGSLENGLIERAKVDRDNPLLHLQLGLIAFRLGELGDSPTHYDEAASEFEWAAELSPEWPFPWYGIGLVEFALRDHQLTPTVTLDRLRKLLDIDEISKSASAYRRSLAADPYFVPALAAMVVTAITDANPSQLSFALTAARQAAEGPASSDQEYWFARGSIERHSGTLDSARLAFERSRETGGDVSFSLMELARTSFVTGQVEAGARLYYAAVDSIPSPRTWGLVRDDLAWIATPEEMAIFDSLAGRERSYWVHRFWSDRDFYAGRPAHSRLAEHFRRIYYAEHHFRRQMRYWQVDRIYPYRGDQRWLDDRGVIYIRHGEPSQTASLVSAAGTIPNLSWKYIRPDTNLIFHFRPQGDVAGIGGYRLVESLLDISATAEMLESRGGLDPIYDQLASANRSERLLFLERERGHAAVVRGTTTDSYVLPFARHLGSVVSGYGLVGDQAGGRILVALAIPLTDVFSGPGVTPGDVQLLDLTVSARDKDGAIRTVDTVIPIRSSQPPAEMSYVSPIVVLALPHGEYQLTVVGRAASGTAGFARHFSGIRVPDRTLFELSDIVLGLERSGVTWFSGSHTIALNPRNRFPIGSNVQVFYEVGGLAPGKSYRTVVDLLKQDGGSPQLTLSFDESATSALLAFQRSFNLGGTGAGAYRLRITIMGSDGKSTSRETMFEVE